MFKKKEEGDDKKDECIVAKKKLVALLKSNPNIFRVLQLPRSAEDHCFVNALTKFDSAFDVLRSCGCSIAEASRAGELLILAVQAPGGKQRKNKSKRSQQMERCANAIAGFCLIALLAMVSVLVMTVTQSTAGWDSGMCSITIFTNQTCNQGPGRCLVEVMVKGQVGAWLVKKDWSLPVAITDGMGGVPLTKYYSEGLRCCNTEFEGGRGVVGSCCSIWDVAAQQFCDNWGHKSDMEGKTCSKGDWQCIYQVDPANPGTVTELKPYVPPNLTPLIACIGVAAFGLAITAVALCVRRAGMDISLDSMKLLSRRKLSADEEDGLEILDGKDPEADLSLDPISSDDDLQDNKRRGSVKLQDGKRRGSTVSLSASDLTKIQSERRSSIVSGSSKQSGSSVSSRNRESTMDARYSHDSIALPGVVEGGETAVGENVLKREDYSADANYDRYIAWTSLGKERNELEEGDIHDGFKLGDLSRLSTRARQVSQEHCSVPIVEPLGKQHRGKSRPQKGSRQKAGQKARPHSVGAPSSWAWAEQELASFEGDHVSDVSHRKSPEIQSSSSSRHRSAPSGKRQGSRTRPTASRSSREGPSHAWSP